jgi:pyocin large subunit-like protein
LTVLGNVGLARALIRGGVAVFRGLQAARTAQFATKSLLASHFKKHGAEFGAKSAKEYLSQAQRFVRSEGLETATRANGDRLLYNASKNEFAVVTKEGTIRTYFKPDDGLRYWQEQIARIEGRW